MEDKSFYIFINADLELTHGQVAAQVAHITAQYARKNGNIGNVRTIILEAPDEFTIRNMYDYGMDNDVDFDTYIEAGTDAIMPFSLTVGAAYLPTSLGKKLYAEFPLYAESKDIALSLRNND